MILTAHQPAYLPWLGYLEKIKRSDVYIYMDDVQFEHRGFIHRNKIKTANGVVWLTVPVQIKGHRAHTMVDLNIDNERNWQKKHFLSIKNAYKKAPYYKEFIAKIERFYTTSYNSMTDYCYDFLLFWLQELGISTKVIKMSDLDVVGDKSELILNLCKTVGADIYISGALGKNYLDDNLFHENGIEVVYQDYKPQTYPQLWGDFIPCLSVLDFVMNTKDYSLIKGKE